jgi:hypothetical protein
MLWRRAAAGAGQVQYGQVQREAERPLAVALAVRQGWL